MFAVVWTTDIAAYFTGRRFGGPKLWPRVSPKKTWSGFLGGLTAAALAGELVVVLGQRWGGPSAGESLRSSCWSPPSPRLRANWAILPSPP